ncbi:hypothetical protein YYE_02703 [Plasmodium vinckei vinckei]|nr:hypothetical protein YYE_02703 [Plasmodium vinckei vinckei]
MAQSSYDIEKVYKEIIEIDGYFGVKKEGENTTEEYKQEIHNYCHCENSSGKCSCNDYFESASSGVFHLLTNLKDTNGLDYDKLAEYAILFLSYKLKQHSKHSGTKLNDFYTKHIKSNKHYNNKIKNSGNTTYMDIIDTNKDLMNIIEMSNFNGLFSILFLLYNECNKSEFDCKKYSEKANEFVKIFEKLNSDSNINENTSYIKLLSTLSNDYDNFKSYCGEKCSDCKDIPILPKIKTPPSKLIIVLSTFSVIPVFLGVAYKYSLFGIDKLFQRQYIRKKLKKVKKKMKLNI